MIKRNFAIKDDGIFEFEARSKKTKLGMAYLNPTTEEKMLITEYELEGKTVIIRDQEKADFIERDNKLYLAV